MKLFLTLIFYAVIIAISMIKEHFSCIDCDHGVSQNKYKSHDTNMFVCLFVSYMYSTLEILFWDELVNSGFFIFAFVKPPELKAVVKF